MALSCFRIITRQSVFDTKWNRSSSLPTPSWQNLGDFSTDANLKSSGSSSSKCRRLQQHLQSLSSTSRWRASVRCWRATSTSLTWAITTSSFWQKCAHKFFKPEIAKPSPSSFWFQVWRRSWCLGCQKKWMTLARSSGIWSRMTVCPASERDLPLIL